jgi:hypothetical protein
MLLSITQHGGQVLADHQTSDIELRAISINGRQAPLFEHLSELGVKQCNSEMFCGARLSGYPEICHFSVPIHLRIHTVVVWLASWP